MIRRTLGAAAFVVLFVTPVTAREEITLPHVYKPGESVSLKGDWSYLLYRTKGSPFRFIRMDDGEAGVDPDNIVDVFFAYVRDRERKELTFLVAVRPGTYWLYGEKTKYNPEGPYLNCLCMGTLRFEARAGTITDLGRIRNLARETRNGKEPDADGNARMLIGSRSIRAIMVEPSNDRQSVPESLVSFPRVAAEYHAAGSLPNIDGTMIDRVSAMPGVIAFDRDRIIDVRTGRVLP